MRMQVIIKIITFKNSKKSNKEAINCWVDYSKLLPNLKKKKMKQDS